MTLHVPFEQFAKTVEHVIGSKEVFVAGHGFGSVATAAHPAKQTLVVCHTDSAPDVVKTKLSEAGMTVSDGAWRLSDEVQSGLDEIREAYIVAVSYRSAESMPGVWVDAHRSLPTPVQALRAMYEEFRETGEAPDVSFEEFVRHSEPNVVIVSPNDIMSFLGKKKEVP